jgi:peptidoglycan/xylan/chitin deacetylase (PgdA/CDA1 family)
VKVVASAADRVRRTAWPAPDGVVVLLYHRVGGRSGSEVDLDVACFEEQMALVAERGHVLSLGAALQRLAAADETAAPATVVTFDDGTADFTDVALPVMARYRIPATLYLATAYVQDGRMPDGTVAVSWNGLADACATGLVDVGSHTDRHILLDRVAAQEVRDDLDRSIELIGSHVGRRPLDFAYPKGVPGNPAAALAVRERFRSAALAGTRANRGRGFDPYRLARSPIQVSDGMTFFMRKLAGGMTLEDDLRRALNRLRYAGTRT